MIFKTLFNSSLLFSMLLVLSLSSNGQADGAKATRNHLLQATATEVEQPEDRSRWVWRNMWVQDSGYGLLSSSYLSNNDTLGGKSCIIADDFSVGADSIWKIDTLRTYLFWYGRAPDRIKVLLWPDLFGLPAEDTICHDFTFTVNMPQQQVLYDMKIDVASQNIMLPTGNYWISFIGVYDTGTIADTITPAYTLWSCKDTTMGPIQCQCMDSIGAYYSPYPTPWLGICFEGQNEYNSVKFWIKADIETKISNSNFQKRKVLVSVYPNPASEHILFRFDNVNRRNIEIYDVRGRLVKTVTARTQNQKVNIKPFTNGIYYYQLADKSGKLIERGRFSVSK